MENLFATFMATISELKASPNKVLNHANREPIVILSQNKPWAYLVPIEVFEKMQEELEDYQLLTEVRERMEDESLSVTLAELRRQISERKNSK